MIDVFAALVDPSRRRILDEWSGRDGMLVTEIAGATGLSRLKARPDAIESTPWVLSRWTLDLSLSVGDRQRRRRSARNAMRARIARVALRAS